MSNENSLTQEVQALKAELYDVSAAARKQSQVLNNALAAIIKKLGLDGNAELTFEDVHNRIDALVALEEAPTPKKSKKSI